MLKTSVRIVASQVLAFPFSCAVGSALSRDSWTIWVTVFGFSLVSASVEHVRDQRGSLFCPSPCLCRSSTEFILNQERLCHIWRFVICAHIEKCSQVFPWCPQNRFESCPSVSPSRKVLRLFAFMHTSSFGVLLVVSHRVRLAVARNSRVVPSPLDPWIEIRALWKRCETLSETSG